MQNPWNIFSFGWDDSILTSHRHALIVTTKMHGFLKWGISHLKGILLCVEQLNSLWASENIWTVLFSLCFRILNFLNVRVACPTWNRLGGWLKVLPTVKVKKGPFLFLKHVQEPQAPYCSFFNWSIKKTWKKAGIKWAAPVHLWEEFALASSGYRASCFPVSLLSSLYSYLWVVFTNYLDHLASLGSVAISSVLFPPQIMPWLYPWCVLPLPVLCSTVTPPDMTTWLTIAHLRQFF